MVVRKTKVLRAVQPRKAKTRSTNAEIAREKLTSRVTVMYATGATEKEICQELDISTMTVRRIKDLLPDEFIEFLNVAKTNEISELIEQGLKENLLATIRITKVTEDEIWLKGQRAPELATFYGVITDKTVRILAAIERSNDRERSEQQSKVPEAESFVRETAEAYRS